jgi:hypothetical protein
MRIRLEYEDGPVFGTFRGPLEDSYRAVLVKINGKPFTVWRTLNLTYGYLMGDKRYIEEVDKALIASMERMLEKILFDACAAIPEGTNLLEKKEAQ